MGRKENRIRNNGKKIYKLLITEMANKPTKKLLYEVSVIRPLIIALLVLFHSFSKIRTGAGTRTNDYELAEIYKWFVWFIQGFRIETIALVAGYVFSYQSHDLGRSYSFWPFVWKKFKRLIIPMIVFGLAYYFLFFFDGDTFNTKDFLTKIMSGCGHLWFLPMLFWCFLSIWLIDYFKINSFWLLVMLALASVIPTPSLPLGFSRLPHFVFYVYGGYFLWTKRDWLLNHCLSKKWIISLWVLYFLIVIVSHVFIPEATASMAIIEKTKVLVSNGVMKLFMAVCGIMALYLTVCSVTVKKGYKPKTWIISANGNCYGVYVYHQFILGIIYFFTPFVYILHPLLVPWVGFAVIMTTSLFLTYLTLKTKIGRFLIG